MKKILISGLVLLFCGGLFAYNDPLARAKSQLGWAEGLMDGIKSNPDYNATQQSYKNINEYLATAKDFLDKGADDPEEKAKLTEWYEKLVKEWDIVKKKYYKDKP